ncbi:MAG: adenylate/guanylate cyclase domain-containing protein, partial [Candidatus Bipolaricaulia bacterium]
MGAAGSSQTVVHFFSDIEGSTRLWETYPEAMRSVIQRHDQLVDGLIEDYGGRVVDHAGDGVFAVFEDGSPLSCAVEIQQAIQTEPWDDIGELRVRMGLHAGKVDANRSDDRGPLANRTARIMDAAHGGQIVVTPDVLDHYEVPEDAEVTDLGSHRLKDLSDPQPIYQLTHPQLTLQEF